MYELFELTDFVAEHGRAVDAGCDLPAAGAVDLSDQRSERSTKASGRDDDGDIDDDDFDEEPRATRFGKTKSRPMVRTVPRAISSAPSGASRELGEIEEIDGTDDYSIAAPQAADETVKRDKRLLKALFEGYMRLLNPFPPTLFVMLTMCERS